MEVINDDNPEPKKLRLSTSDDNESVLITSQSDTTFSNSTNTERLMADSVNSATTNNILHPFGDGRIRPAGFDQYSYEVLDEVCDPDDNIGRGDSLSSISSDEEIDGGNCENYPDERADSVLDADDNLEDLLERDLPEKYKGSRPIEYRKVLKEFPTVRKKMVLVDKGQSPVEPLPKDWIMCTHISGVPVYLHRETRVATLSRPYFLGPASLRYHDVPMHSVPCLQYRVELLRESVAKFLSESQNSHSSVNEIVDKCENQSKVIGVDSNEDIPLIKNIDENTYKDGSFNIKNLEDECKDKSFFDIDNEVCFEDSLEVVKINESSCDVDNETSAKDNLEVVKINKLSCDVDNETSAKDNLEVFKINVVDNKVCVEDNLEVVKKNEPSSDVDNEACFKHNIEDVKIEETVAKDNDYMKVCTGIETICPRLENVTTQSISDQTNKDPSQNLADSTQLISTQEDMSLPDSYLKGLLSMHEEGKDLCVPALNMSGYCKRLFHFRQVDVVNFKSWKERRIYNNIKRRKSMPKLFQSSKLLSFPIESEKSKMTKRKLEWVLNPNGKSLISILHEYVQHVKGTQPVYTYTEIENSTNPYLVRIFIQSVVYGAGVGSSKRIAKTEAAKSALSILLPEQYSTILEGTKDQEFVSSSNSNTNEKSDLSFFESVAIDDPRIAELCIKAAEPSPYNILLSCLKHNFGIGSREIQQDMQPISSTASGHTGSRQHHRFELRVGERSATVVCKNRRQGRSLASQQILKQLHPHVTMWASLLRLYGDSSLLNMRQHARRDVTRLQQQQPPVHKQNKQKSTKSPPDVPGDGGEADGAPDLEGEGCKDSPDTPLTSKTPNNKVLEKLRYEMRKLFERQAKSVLPLGKNMIRFEGAMTNSTSAMPLDLVSLSDYK